ncbi:MAG: hypothetical protein JNN18_14535 [Rubrivivax sp.]|nr:hypothetical protein [Rubrivivax sp.]
MSYLVRIQRQRAGSTTRGWQVRAYWAAPRYVSRFFNAADHGGMAGARAAAEAAGAAAPEPNRQSAMKTALYRHWAAKLAEGAVTIDQMREALNKIGTKVSH